VWERSKVKGRDVIHADDQITVYEAQGKERLTRPGKHLIVVINIHAESVYQLVSADRCPGKALLAVAVHYSRQDADV
jgi:hypothetical protein